MNTRQRQYKQLGMPYGTACGRLRKIIMFHLIQKLKLDTCVRCKKLITNINDLSIEHIKPWLDIDINLFWDLNNIGFSHLSCNSKASRNPQKKKKVKGKYWCWRCKKYLEKEKFPPSRSKKHTECTKCYSAYRSEYRKRTGKR